MFSQRKPWQREPWRGKSRAARGRFRSSTGLRLVSWVGDPQTYSGGSNPDDKYAAGYDGTGDAACETVHDFARWSTQSGPAAEDASLFKSRHPGRSPSWLTII